VSVVRQVLRQVEVFAKRGSGRRHHPIFTPTLPASSQAGPVAVGIPPSTCWQMLAPHRKPGGTRTAWHRAGDGIEARARRRKSWIFSSPNECTEPRPCRCVKDSSALAPGTRARSLCFHVRGPIHLDVAASVRGGRRAEPLNESSRSPKSDRQREGDARIADEVVEVAGRPVMPASRSPTRASPRSAVGDRMPEGAPSTAESSSSTFERTENRPHQVQR